MSDPVLDKLDSILQAEQPSDPVLRKLDAIIAGQPPPAQQRDFSQRGASPQTKPLREEGILDQPEAFISGMLRGIPIIGHQVADIPNKMDAGIDVMLGNAPSYQEALEARRARMSAVRAENPGTTLAGEITGGVATMLPAVAAAPAMFGAGAAQSTGSRIVAGGVSGALLSGADSLAKTGNPDQAKFAALLGGGLGAVLAPVGAKVSEAISRRTSPIPTLDEMRTQTAQAFARADRANIILTPKAEVDLMESIVRTVQSMNYVPGTHTGTQGVVGILNNALVRASNNNRTLTLHELDQVIQAMGQQRPRATMATPLDTEIANAAFQEARRFIVNLRPGHTTGNVSPATINQAILEGRGLAARTFKMEELQSAVEAARMHPAGTTFGDALKTQLRQLTRGREFTTFYTPTEQEAIKSIIRQTTIDGIARQALRLSANSPILWGIVGGMVHSPGAGLAVGALGYGTRAAGNQIVNARPERAVTRAIDAVGQGMQIGAPPIHRQGALNVGGAVAASTAQSLARPRERQRAY